MSDLKNPKLIYSKGLMFLATGALASGIIIAEHPSVRLTFLLAVAVWSFCRAYYFAFYVVENYVVQDPTTDGRIRLRGLWDGLKIAVRPSRSRLYHQTEAENKNSTSQAVTQK